MILLRNRTAYELPVSQLPERERIDAGAPGRVITGPVMLAAGDAIEISADEAKLFAGNSCFVVEVTK